MTDDELYRRIWEQISPDETDLLCIPDGVSKEQWDRVLAQVEGDYQAEVRGQQGAEQRETLARDAERRKRK